VLVDSLWQSKLSDSVMQLGVHESSLERAGEQSSNNLKCLARGQCHRLGILSELQVHLGFMKGVPNMETRPAFQRPQTLH
jgi:hypothetical protein